MNDSVYKISLDINEHGSQTVLKAKKSDTGRKIYITLRAGGTPYPIADDCYAVFAATKPDGSILYNACTIENNEIIYEFTGQTCSAVGRIRCEIKLYGKDEKLITSPRFALLVDGTVYPDGRVESQDEFSALTQMVSDTLTAQALAREATEDAKSATNTANVAAENANEAAKKATDAAANLTCNNVTDEKYFDIDYDGVVSLQSDYQAGGSKNAELPEVIVIPDVIGTTAVSALADSMFEKNTRIKSITIPSTVIAIPYKFASDAIHLEEINGTENIESIGRAAFQATRIKKALFPKLKQFDDGGAFNYCAQLTIADIGDNITTILGASFQFCERLSIVRGGAKVKQIDASAFRLTRNLKNLPLLSNDGISIGSKAFELSRVDDEKVKPTDDWWSGCTYTPCVNPLGSTFSQYNPVWANDQIRGSEDDTYSDGCTEISAAHIYSALSGIKFDSPKYFVEEIVGGIGDDSLFVPTGIENGKPAYIYADMGRWLTALGLDCDLRKNPGYSSKDNLQDMYDALADGALILSGIHPGHSGVIYGVADNGELLTLDSNSYLYKLGIYEAATFQQPIWSLVTKDVNFMIVRRRGPNEAIRH